MNFTLLLIFYVVAGLVGLVASIDNVKHAEAPKEISPVPASTAGYYKWATVGFFGVTFLALLAATRTTDIASPHTTGIGSWTVCWLIALAAAQSFWRAFLNGVRMRKLARYSNYPAALHPMLRSR